MLDPLEGYYYFGAGGGQSQFFAKPAWQSSLPGSWRQVPDVSALADPFTGFPIIYTQGSQQFGAVYGGTSLASPIFTATWAIADQYNGAPLGFASPILATLGAGQITDVVPPPATVTNYNPYGLLTDGTTTTSLSWMQVYTEAENLNDFPNLLTLYSQTHFLSTVFPGAFGESPSVFDLAVSFGTDSSLTVTKGWDNVTGWGETQRPSLHPGRNRQNPRSTPCRKGGIESSSVDAHTRAGANTPARHTHETHSLCFSGGRVGLKPHKEEGA